MKNQELYMKNYRLPIYSNILPVLLIFSNRKNNFIKNLNKTVRKNCKAMST